MTAPTMMAKAVQMTISNAAPPAVFGPIRTIARIPSRIPAAPLTLIFPRRSPILTPIPDRIGQGEDLPDPVGHYPALMNFNRLSPYLSTMRRILARSFTRVNPLFHSS